jgi:hypothetical protein
MFELQVAGYKSQVNAQRLSKRAKRLSPTVSNIESRIEVPRAKTQVRLPRSMRTSPGRLKSGKPIFPAK